MFFIDTVGAEKYLNQKRDAGLLVVLMPEVHDINDFAADVTDDAEASHYLCCSDTAALSVYNFAFCLPWSLGS